MTEKELPKIDFPENWLIGTDISKELLASIATIRCD